jgi:hypothetical protein
MFSLISWGAVIVGVIVSVVLGSVWYGLLFGKKWAALMGMDMSDSVKVAEAKKGMWKMYAIQMIASAVTVSVLSVVLLKFDNFTTSEMIGSSLLMWFGFVLPTEIGTVLWGNKSKKDAISIFMINTGYGFILFILLGLIVSKALF